MAAAETRDEVVELIREAIDFHLEDMLDRGDTSEPIQLDFEIVEENA